MSIKVQGPPLWHLRDTVAKLDYPASKGSPGTKSLSKASVTTSCTFPETITIDASRKDHGSFESKYSCNDMTIDREQQISGGGRDVLIARTLSHPVMDAQPQLVGPSTSTSIVSKNIQNSTTSLGSSTSNHRAVLDSLMSTSNGSLSGAFLGASPYSDNFAATSHSRLAEDEASDPSISVISGMIGQDEGQHSVFSDITGGFSSSSDGRHLAEIVATPETSKIVSTTIDEANVSGPLVMSAPRAPGERVSRGSIFMNVKGEQKEKPSVRFHAVHVRYYERILSDNPAVTAGPAVGLGWKYTQAPKTYHIDEWEDIRGCSRRSLAQLILPRYERTTMVIELGYNHKQVAEVIRTTLRIKHNRTVTYHNLRAQKMEEFMEKTTRRFKKVVTLGFMTRKDKTKLKY